AATGEPAQRDPALRRERDGQRARCADADKNRRARHRSLLHELERQPPAHAYGAPVERDQPIEQGTTDDLVERVVPAYVLTGEDQPSVCLKQAGGVKTPGVLERRLLEQVWEPRH